MYAHVSLETEPVGRESLGCFWLGAFKWLGLRKQQQAISYLQAEI